MAFTPLRRPQLVGNLALDQTGQFRNADPDFVRAVSDARSGNSTDAIQQLVDYGLVDGAKYEKMKQKVFHLMPHHKTVLRNN